MNIFWNLILAIELSPQYVFFKNFHISRNWEMYTNKSNTAFVIQ